MKKRLKRFFRSYQGRHFLSRYGRYVFERQSARSSLGLFLILTVFSLSILTPQTQAFVESVQSTNTIDIQQPIIETTTEPTFRYPLLSVHLSQGFSWHHWGIDLTAPEGDPVFPIAKGKIVEIGKTLVGYGNYVLIDHQNGQKSLYAHLSKQEVKNGQEITKDSVIGLVGHTGWATGDHLHLEIYQNGLPLNPLEVLPDNTLASN